LEYSRVFLEENFEAIMMFLAKESNEEQDTFEQGQAFVEMG
jgi:hypothetical protein